ncbi:GNAT family N-acetyltransferase [Rhizobium sp.]|uniref:GNAT family N-acetyltransferase n=1 Tax=Rhizobium sp. TaxID=391 RepID=UPI000E88B87D|nr:N-acetyltransferase [Rhizobium sp.]
METVRLITADDHPGLLALWRETWTATYGPILGEAALNRSLEDLAENGTASMLPGSGERGYCITDGQSIQASAIVVERGTVAYLWGMYVHPSCQRQGLGSLLLKGAAAQIVTSADIEIRVLPTSPWAIRFYQKHGFVQTGTEDTELTAGASAQTLIMSVKVERLKALPNGL